VTAQAAGSDWVCSRAPRRRQVPTPAALPKASTCFGVRKLLTSPSPGILAPKLRCVPSTSDCIDADNTTAAEHVATLVWWIELAVQSHVQPISCNSLLGRQI
jgi:hypothetical protein